jgi:WD40 repeat protein
LITSSLAVHPMNDTLACGTARGEVLELDISTGRTKRVMAQHNAGVESLAVSRDGSRVASIGFDRRLIVTDWQTAEIAWSRPHHANGEVCFSPTGDTLVSSGYTDRHWSIMTWDADTGEQQTTLNGHARVILGLAFTSDRTLYSWGADGSIRAWDLNLGRETEAYRPEPPC